MEGSTRGDRRLVYVFQHTRVYIAALALFGKRRYANLQNQIDLRSIAVRRRPTSELSFFRFSLSRTTSHGIRKADEGAKAQTDKFVQRVLRAPRRSAPDGVIQTRSRLRAHVQPPTSSSNSAIFAICDVLREAFVCPCKVQCSGEEKAATPRVNVVRSITQCYSWSKSESVVRFTPLHTASVGKHVRQPFFFTHFTTNRIFKRLGHVDGIC